MNDTEILWGRHPNYAWGHWIKLGRGQCSDEFELRSKEGFDLVYRHKGQNPNGDIVYHPGHPWYYFLGGRALYPKEIFNAIKRDGYKGYLGEWIDKVNRKPEPQRSEALRELRAEEIVSYKEDLSVYRLLARQLKNHFKDTNKPNGINMACDSIHTSLSLKHNHLYNRFAHLITLDDLLSQQPDLFG